MSSNRSAMPTIMKRSSMCSAFKAFQAEVSCPLPPSMTTKSGNGLFSSNSRW